MAGTLHPCDVQNVAKKGREGQGENKEAKKQRSSARRPVLNAPVTKSPGNLMPRELPVHIASLTGSSLAVRKLRVWLGVHSDSLTIDMHLV